MSQDKDEIVKMAREAGAAPEDGVSGFWVAQTEDLQRFYTLCRAPLVAEVERLEQWHAEMADNRNAIASERDTLKAELARVRAGKPVAWLVTGPYEKRAFDMRGFAEAYCSGLNQGAGETIYKVSDLVMSIGEHEKCTDERMCIACFSGQGKCENPTPPQPAAQEPVAWNHGCNALCADIDLWIDHCPHCGKPRPAAPAPQEPTSAVPVVRQMVEALDLAAPYFTHNNQVTAAIAAGKKFIKENGK